MKYELEVQFESDYELNSEQLDDLLGYLALQIEEPMRYSGEADTWTSKNIKIDLIEKAKDVSLSRRILP